MKTDQRNFEERTRRAVSASTLKAYASDWSAFTSWCALENVQALPAEPATVLRYLLMMEADSKVSSLRRRLVAIRRTHRDHGHELDVRDPEFQREWLAMSSRNRSDARPRRRTSREDVTALVNALPLGLMGLRDRALILVGWATGCRPSELVGLDHDEMELTRRCVRLTLRRRRGADATLRAVEIPRHAQRELCAVRWLRAWITVARIEKGPLFRPVNRHGRIAPTRLSVQAVRIVLRRAALRAGLEDPDLCGDGWRPSATA